MKLSVFFDHVLQAQEQNGKSIKELLPGIRSSGIEAVEMNLSYLCEHPEVLKLLEACDLKISCLYEFYDMGHCDESEKSRRHIETAAKVKATRILAVPGFLSGEASREMQNCMPSAEKIGAFFEKNDDVRRMKEGLSFVAKLGREQGVTVTVEDFDDRNSPLAGMYGIQWFLKQIPELMYTLDTGNFLFYGENVLEAWELLKTRVVHVHCKDRKAENHASVRTGSGYILFKEVLNNLRMQQYDGYLAIEHFDVEEQETCIKQSAEFLRRLV